MRKVINKMEIALICTEKLPSPSIRGGAIQIMIDGIIPFFRENHQVTVFSITDPLLPDREVQHTVEYVRFPKHHYEEGVAEELKQRRFDVIHVFNRPKNILLYKKAAPQSLFVLSLHNDMFSELKLNRNDGMRVIQSVEAITAVSKYIKQTVTVRYPQAESKVHVLYSGVDLSKFSPRWTGEGKKIRDRIRKQYHLEDKKVILFVGRLSKTKGPDLLIESLQYLIPNHPEAVLVLVGGRWFSDNSIDGFVQKLYDLANPYHDHVVFTQYIPPEQIPAMLTMGDVFVCSSQWHEPLARVHYEAMAAGIPIVTTNRGGNREVIDQGVDGIIIDDYDEPRAFAEAIDTLLSKPALAESLAMKGRERVEEQHQFHYVAAHLMKIHMNIFTNKSGKTTFRKEK